MRCSRTGAVDVVESARIGEEQRDSVGVDRGTATDNAVYEGAIRGEHVAAEQPPESADAQVYGRSLSSLETGDLDRVGLALGVQDRQFLATGAGVGRRVGEHGVGRCRDRAVALDLGLERGVTAEVDVVADGVEPSGSHVRFDRRRAALLWLVDEGVDVLVEVRQEDRCAESCAGGRDREAVDVVEVPT